MIDAAITPAMDRLIEAYARSFDNPRVVLSFPCVSFVPGHEVPLGKSGKPRKPCGHCRAGEPRPAFLAPGEPWPPPMPEGLICSCCHRAGEATQERCDSARVRDTQRMKSRSDNNELTEGTPVPAIVATEDAAKQEAAKQEATP